MSKRRKQIQEKSHGQGLHTSLNSYYKPPQRQKTKTTPINILYWLALFMLLNPPISNLYISSKSPCLVQFSCLSSVLSLAIFFYGGKDRGQNKGQGRGKGKYKGKGRRIQKDKDQKGKSKDENMYK
jgi:hypothetical protein